MFRKCGKTISLALAAAALMLAAPFTSQAAPIVIKVGASTNAYMSQYEPWKKFQEIMEKEGKGRFKIEFFLGGVMGTCVDIFEKVQMGALQMGNGSSSNLSTYVPELGALETPFVLTRPEQYKKLYYPGELGKQGILNGPFFDRINAEFLKRGTRIMHACPFQFRMLGMTHKNMSTPKAVAGKKLRVTSSVVEREVVAAFGMTPTNVPWGELYTALQQGVVDGVDLNIDDIVAMKFSESVVYLNKVPFNSYGALSYVNERFYQSLSKEDRELFDRAWREAFLFADKTFNDHVEKATKQMEAEGKMEIHTPTAEEMAQWEAAAKPVIDSNIKKYDPELIKIINTLLAE